MMSGRVWPTLDHNHRTFIQLSHSPKKKHRDHRRPQPNTFQAFIIPHSFWCFLHFFSLSFYDSQHKTQKNVEYNGVMQDTVEYSMPAGHFCADSFYRSSSFSRFIPLVGPEERGMKRREEKTKYAETAKALGNLWLTVTHSIKVCSCGECAAGNIQYTHTRAIDQHIAVCGTKKYCVRSVFCMWRWSRLIWYLYICTRPKPYCMCWLL